jgi:hypothetical protein
MSNIIKRRRRRIMSQSKKIENLNLQRNQSCNSPGKRSKPILNLRTAMEEETM